MMEPIRRSGGKGRRAPVRELVLFLAYLPACHSWHTETVAPQAVIEAKHPDQIRIVRADGTTQVLHGPTVLGDTLRGRPSETAVRLADVQTIATRRTNVPLTALTVVGGAAVVGLGVWLAVCGTAGAQSQQTC